MYDERHSLSRTLGSAALGVGLGLGVLALGFTVSRVALADNVVVTGTFTPSATAAPAASPTARATPAATVAPTLAPATAPPAPTPDPIVVSPYQGQGIRLAAITIPAGYTVRSPIAGTVRIDLYQYIDGEIRQGVEGQTSYPYVFVTSSDREVKLRPGAVGRDVELLVKNGDGVAAGAPLFRTLTTAASSWSLFYDGNIKAQVMASAREGDAEIDPVPLFKK